MKRKISEKSALNLNNIAGVCANLNQTNPNSSLNSITGQQYLEDSDSNNNLIVGSKKINKGEKGDPIKTFCRIKPQVVLNSNNNLSADPWMFKICENNNTILLVNQEICVGPYQQENKEKSEYKQTPQTFIFSKVFEMTSTQKDVFEVTCLPLLEDLIKNKKSGLLFTYGLTNSGKTYTMIGEPSNPGILPMALNYIIKSGEQSLDNLNDNVEKNENSIPPQIFCNFIEIYNEEIFDLLANEVKGKRKKLALKEKGKIFYLPNVTNKKIERMEDFQNALNDAVNRKTHAQTNLNPKSSRSHTIFKIILKFPTNTPEEYEEASISLVDLAGSERAYRAETSGKELQQACKINQSLSVLGKCMDSMRYNTQYVGKKIVPFRESKLTMIFQEYFQGEQNISMLTNINTSKEDREETLRVLTYSCVAKEIRPIKSKIITVLNNNISATSNFKKTPKLGFTTSDISDYYSADEDSVREGKFSVNSLNLNRNNSLSNNFSNLSNINTLNNPNNNNINLNSNPFQQNTNLEEVSLLKLQLQNLKKNYESQEERLEKMEKINQFRNEFYKNREKKNEMMNVSQIISSLETFSKNLVTSSVLSVARYLDEFRRPSENYEGESGYVIPNPFYNQSNSKGVINNKKQLPSDDKINPPKNESQISITNNESLSIIGVVISKPGNKEKEISQIEQAERFQSKNEEPEKKSKKHRKNKLKNVSEKDGIVENLENSDERISSLHLENIDLPEEKEEGEEKFEPELKQQKKKRGKSKKGKNLKKNNKKKKESEYASVNSEDESKDSTINDKFNKAAINMKTINYKNFKEEEEKEVFNQSEEERDHINETKVNYKKAAKKTKKETKNKNKKK